MNEQSPKRCLFCGRAKGDLVDPADPASRKVKLTREHVFRSTWKEKLDVHFLPADSPLSVREMTRYGIDGSRQSARPDPLFETVVKPVCDHCNNGWMNDLDSAVEPWIFNQTADVDVVQFRRWAIKVAVLRSYLDNPLAPQPEDFRALHDGDIPNWRIFIGHTLLPNHMHVFAGYGVLDGRVGGRLMGITQVTWSLGRVFIVAMRLVGESASRGGFFKIFKQSNRADGTLVAEVLPNAKRFPSLAFLPEISLHKLDKIAWFMSTNPISPISDGIRQLEESFRQLMDEEGANFTDLGQ